MEEKIDDLGAKILDGRYGGVLGGAGVAENVLAECDGRDGMFMFFCPACGCGHFFNNTWKWNGDRVKPTVTPSIKVLPDGCHFFVTDGQLVYCGDTPNRHYASRSVTMIPIKDW